jgi:hypothetical protein
MYCTCLNFPILTADSELFRDAIRFQERERRADFHRPFSCPASQLISHSFKMTTNRWFNLFITVLTTTTLVLGAPTTCSQLGSGSSSANDAFWMENIKHQGLAAFNSNPSTYQVFRNVKVCASALAKYLQ